MERPAHQRQYPKSERTRARILAAGMALIREKGYENVTIREICDGAGVSIGAFYSHFKGKQSLFRDFYRNSDVNFASTVAAELKGTTAVERMTDFVRYYAWLNIGTGVQDLTLIMNLEQEHHPDALPLHDLMRSIIVDGQASGELTRDLSAQELTDMLFTFMRGCCYEWCLQNGGFDLEQRLISYLSRLIGTLTV